MTSGAQGRLDSIELRVGLIAGLLALAWAIVTLDPLGPATIDPDASSSVLYFQRILSGLRLEAFVPTTPKPLLTVVYGLSWTVGHDWRWLAWETILVFGVACGAAAALVARLLGRLADATPPGGGSMRGALGSAAAGAAFTTGALLGSSDLLLEVSRANSLVWALAFWLAAGLAATARPVRPWLAGLALMLAGLCRLETLALDVLAAGLVAAVVVRERRPGGSRAIPTGMAGAVLVALAAAPLALLHDFALSGDPLWFTTVEARYTAIFNPDLRPMGLLDYVAVFGAREGPKLPLVALGAVGIVALLRGGERLAAAGLLAIGGGVMGLLFLLASRGWYISNRYYEPLDLALFLAAAVGAGWIAGRVLERMSGAFQPGGRPVLVAGGSQVGGPLRGLAAMALAGVAAVVLAWPALPWDRRAGVELADVRRSSAHLALVRPNLERALTPGGQSGSGAAAASQLLVPSRDVSRLSVEFGERLDRILNSYAVLRNEGVAGLRSGQVVFHDAAADRPVALYRSLEIADQTPVDGRILVRLEPRVPELWLLVVR